MPRGDRTGPAGMGPKTGRRAGYCAGYNVPGYMNPGVGFGWGRGMRYGSGMGLGRGWGRAFGCWGCPFCGFAQPLTAKDEKKALSEYKKDLEEEVKNVDMALNDISKSK